MKRFFSSPRKRYEEGFGLVELVVVIAIVGVLTLVAVPVYGAVQENAETVRAQKVANDLYTSVASIYETQSPQAAAAYIQNVNKQEPSLVFIVQDLPDQPDLRNYQYSYLSEPRFTMERIFKLVPDAYNQAVQYWRMGSGLAMLDPKTTPAHLLGDGTFMCVIGFWNDGNVGQEKIKKLVFAGPGCGTKSYNSEADLP
jgi:prepilin-type N-terminal cleavage/methylation domain-containing protein